MEDSVVIHEFLDYLQFEKRFSEHTAKCYGADLQQFTEFLIAQSESAPSDPEPISLTQQQGGPATALATEAKPKVDQLILSVDVNSVRAYLALLNEKQYSKSTIARKLATLRSFYKFLVRRNRLSSNPVTVRNRRKNSRVFLNMKK
jgi:integrase/recombinase XerC